MGITTAPSTGAIMRSLPLHKAGVGSAVNDTTRELGGALGVAVLGSLVASHFRSSMHGAVQRAARRRRRTRSPTRCRRGAAVGGVRGGAIAHAAQDVVRRRVHVDAVGGGRSSWWSASGLVAWLLRPKATAEADAMVEADEAAAHVAIEAA